MIQAVHVGDEVRISVNADRRPRLYLDKFAIVIRIKRGASGAILHAVQRRSLLFSHMNLMEVGLLRGGSASAKLSSGVRAIAA